MRRKYNRGVPAFQSSTRRETTESQLEGRPFRLTQGERQGHETRMTAFCWLPRGGVSREIQLEGRPFRLPKGESGEMKLE
jgi:hypothetical protein